MMQYSVEIVLRLFDQFSRALSQPIEQVKKLENELKNTQETAAKLQSPFQKLQRAIKEAFDIEHIKNFTDKLDNFSSEVAKATAIPLAGVGGSLWAFADLDQAKANMEVAFMLNKNAATPEELKENEKYLKEISKQAIELGNLYPGSTKDYYEMATALKEVGLSAETISNGALKASANLWVLVKDSEHISTEQVADYIGKFKEAYNIADKDFGQFVDRVQKVKFATGLRLDEIAYASKDLAPTLNLLNLKGMQAFNTVSTLLGVLRKMGVDGTVAGVSVKDALERLAKLDSHVKTLQKKGIKFELSSKDFFQDGQFQLEKFFAVLRDKLSQVKDVNLRMEIMQEIFGQEGLRGVALLVNGTKEQAMEYIDTLLRMKKITEKEYQDMKDQINQGGFTGLEKVANDIQKQANAQERTERLIHTFKNTFEALEGTFINLSATIGSLFAPALTSAFTKLNDYLSKMQDWIEAHRTLASTIALSIGGSLGFLAMLGIMAKIGSIFLSLSIAGFKVISMFGKLAFVIVRMIIPALNLLKMAFITNPLGLLITAITGAIVGGYLLWKNWSKITAWFKSHFPNVFGAISAFIKGFKEGITPALQEPSKALEPLKEAFKQLFNAVRPVFDAIGSLFTLTNKSSNTTKHLSNSIKETANSFKVFEAIGQTLAFVLSIPIKLITWDIKVITFFVEKITEAIKTISNLNLFEAGKKILTTLVDGIKSVANKPVEVMRSIVQKIRNLLPFSPAKEGPLRDLHRIKLIETIADTIKPSPLIERMQNVLSKALLPVPLMASSVSSTRTPTSNISVHIGNITISASSKSDIAPSIASELEKEIRRVLEKINSDRERRKY
ncbi:MAG: phage tail tape measure protein [Sulfurihydrogenibium sp.]|nr:phage tail tape measure protein [Sulfurihydrogenibium sp.]